MSKKLTTEEIIYSFLDTHKDLYDYSKVNYIKSTIKVAIICKLHGIFYQNANHHIHGSGCPKCSLKKNTKFKLNNIEDILYKFNKKHKNRFDYSLFKKYSGQSINIEIICPLHGIFLQTPKNHLKYNGCKKCSNLTKKWGKPKSNTEGILYYIKIDNLYKIGITKYTVKERFIKKEFSKIEIIKELRFNNIQNAWHVEQAILKMYKDFLYIGVPVLRSGNSELFLKNILKG